MKKHQRTVTVLLARTGEEEPTLEETDGSLESLLSLLGCDWLATHDSVGGTRIWYDDEGRLASKPPNREVVIFASLGGPGVFGFWPTMIAGNVLISGPEVRGKLQPLTHEQIELQRSLLRLPQDRGALIVAAREQPDPRAARR